MVSLVLKHEVELEDWASAFLRLKVHAASELMDDVFRDMKPKTNSILVHALGILNKAKKLEDFWLIFFFDAYSSVLNTDYDLILKFLGHHMDVAIKGELDGIGNKA